METVAWSKLAVRYIDENKKIVLLNQNEDTSNKIVRTELSYYRKTHQAARYETPELFKLTKISHEERLENLFVLLSNGTNKIASISSTAMLDIPTLMKNYRV